MSTDDLSPKEPECLPLKTLEDVLNWSAGQDDLSISTVPLSTKFTSSTQSCPKTLVCHDMAGGYLDDRFDQGVKKDDCYRFTQWNSIDSFIYFSHYFVTIPPPCWTNPAHKHGVLMLGTFITEWDDGAARCRQVFASEQSAQNVADKLVEIATYYRFDGWLINIENPIKSQEMAQLQFFVRYLTDKMHSAVSHSQVIWYDSVIATGELRWQDEVNEKNSMFFDACDGIFLNYCWKEESLIRSAELSRERNRPFDVYVGIDVFGRGCLGGGGFNTKEALEAARKHNLSVAIFAPGWVYEKLGAENFTENQNKFWNLLEPNLHKKKLTKLPLCTSFGHGFGKQFFLEGKVYSHQPWTNQSMQPLQINEADDSSATLCLDDAYIGGGCLQMTAKSYFQKIFVCDIQLPQQTYVSYTFKPQSHCDVCMQIVCSKADGTSMYMYLTGGSAESEGIINTLENRGEILKPLSPESLPSCWKTAISVTEKSWITRVFCLNTAVNEDVLLKEISFCCHPSHNAKEGKSDLSTCTALLGELKVISSDDVCKYRTPHLSSVTHSQVNITAPGHDKSGPDGGEDSTAETKQLQLSTVLSWDPLSDVQYYVIYYRLLQTTSSGSEEAPYVYHGTAMTNKYSVCQLLVAQECAAVEFCVQPITQLEFCDLPERCKSCVVRLDECEK